MKIPMIPMAVLCFFTFIGGVLANYGYQFFHEKDYKDAWNLTFYQGIAIFAVWFNAFLFWR